MINLIIISLLLVLIILYLNYYLIGNNQLEQFDSKDQLFDRCFVINLKDTKAGQTRWKAITTNPIVKDFIERFPAIDGRKYDFNQEISNQIITRQWDFGGWKSGVSKLIDMSKPEIGCILSHYYLWKKIVKDRIQTTLVLEDDSSNISSDFNKVVKQTLAHVPLDWDIILMGFWCHRDIKCRKINRYVYKVKDFALTHCYLINYKGAQKALSLLPIDMPIDSWLSSKSDKLNIYRHNEIVPNRSKATGRIIGQGAFESQNIWTNVW